MNQTSDYLKFLVESVLCSNYYLIIQYLSSQQINNNLEVNELDFHPSNLIRIILYISIRISLNWMIFVNRGETNILNSVETELMICHRAISGFLFQYLS